MPHEVWSSCEMVTRPPVVNEFLEKVQWQEMSSVDHPPKDVYVDEVARVAFQDFCRLRFCVLFYT